MKNIYLAISLILLGSLACIYSAPGTPTPEPIKTQSARALTLATAPARSDCTVNTHALNVRSCGSVHCSITGWLLYGQTVRAEPGAGWQHVTRGELAGFVRAKYLTCNLENKP